MDFDMKLYYANHIKLVQNTKHLRESLDAIYPESMSLMLKRIRAIQDGIITPEESELLREYIIATGG